MKRLLLIHITFIIAYLWCLTIPAIAQPTTWQTPTTQDVRARVFTWLDAKNVDPAARSQVEALWSDAPTPASEEDLLVRVARSYSVFSAEAAELLSMCSHRRGQGVVPDQPWLTDGGAPGLFTANLRLLYARWLVHESLFDEAQEQLAGLAPGDVVAPASLLFYQSVVSHALLNKESGLKSIEELLQGVDSSPRRYIALARLMQNDLQGLEDDTLDHIARRMNDIRRRLDLGRAGPKVRKVEDGVIESLDKMIQKIEEQQQQQCSGGTNTLQPGLPASESRPRGGKGPGEVTKKNIGAGSGWGDLPPHERDEAMQQIGRDFPSHYRDAIEQYFRRMATEGSE